MEDVAAVLVAVGTIVGASVGAYVAFKLGRGAAREDRLRGHELDSSPTLEIGYWTLPGMARLFASLEPCGGK